MAQIFKRKNKTQFYLFSAFISFGPFEYASAFIDRQFCFCGFGVFFGAGGGGVEKDQEFL